MTNLKKEHEIYLDSREVDKLIKQALSTQKQDILKMIDELEIDFGAPFFDKDYDDDELIEYIKEELKQKLGDKNGN